MVLHLNNSYILIFIFFFQSNDFFSFLLVCVSFVQRLIFEQGSNKKNAEVRFLDIIVFSLLRKPRFLRK